MLTLKNNLKREKKIDQSKILHRFNAIQAELPFLQLGQQDKRRLRSQDANSPLNVQRNILSRSCIFNSILII